VVGVGLVGVVFSTDLALVGLRSPATWLVVFGILLGEATRASGLARLVETRTLGAMPARLAGDPVATYRYLLATMAVAGLGLAVLVPSSLVRVLLLGPVALSVGEVFDARRPRIGLFLGPLFVTYYGGTGILTASLANVIVADLATSSAGLVIGWVEWLAWLGPVMGVGRAVAVTAVAYVLYRPAPDASVTAPADTPTIPETAVERPDADPTQAVTATQRRMLAFLLVGVAIWSTDAIHGLHPMYGALVVALLAFAPRIGVVDADTLADADLSIVFFLGAIFAIAAGLQQTGFTDLAARRALALLPADAALPLVLVGVLGVSLLLTGLMEGLAVASVLTPVLTSFAASAGVPLVPVVMTEAIALNTYFFPYQSAVLVGILGLDVVGPRELVRMATACSLVTLLVLVPIQFAIFGFAF
jgi:di/tricarboxylate transporter